MTTDLTWAMNTSLWTTLTPEHSLKATFHLTISIYGQRETGKIQRNNSPSRELRAVFNG